jgi:coatomer subunit beta
VIFGTIVYEVRGTTSDRNAVYLNDIHIDIMDYIVPATCSDTEFRHMWAEFEWENKVRFNLFTDFIFYFHYTGCCEYNINKFASILGSFNSNNKYAQFNTRGCIVW